MTREEIITNLKYTMEKHKNDKVYTFDTNISMMCKDILDYLEHEYDDMGEVSDGYHTFNQLYHQRAVLFATIVNQNKDKAWKSFKHSDGKYCFDSNGEWFIVGVDTPDGSYTYHYSKEYWDMFKCKELDCGKEWDGHTEKDVTRLLSLEPQEPMVEIDLYSVIKQTYIEREVLDKIRAEIIDKYMTATGEVNTVAKGCLQILDKYKKEGEQE